MDVETAGTPGLALYLTEPARAVADYGLLLSTAALLPLLPRGDGHPVLVLPGLLASDSSTWILRWILRGLGYPVRGWSLGRNVGPTAQASQGVRRRLDQLTEHYGRPASVIGWSLGGLYARALAHRTPASIRQVITLASPFGLASTSQTRAHRAFERHSHLHVERWRLPLESGRPLPVPTTSVYSRLDGIVAWRACLNPPSPRAENVQVRSSHLGMGHHPGVIWAVADRLGQPDGEWSPYRPPVRLPSLLSHGPSN